MQTRKRMRARARALAAAGVAALMAVGLLGCSPDEQPQAEPAQQVNGLPAGVELPQDVPTDVPNDPNARSNVALAACEATDDGWRALGTATNPADDTATYTVTVFFTTDSGTVIAHGETTSEVAAQQTAEWTVETDATVPKNTACVIRGVAEA